MKKPAIIKLGVGVLTMLLVYGCQNISRGPTDEELINTTMADWKTAVIAKDLDNLMVVYSENYVSRRGDGKESVRNFMARVFERGHMDNVKVNLENAETTIEEDKATFGPVEFIFDRGTRMFEYTLQKEGNSWLIVRSKRQEQ